MNPSRIFHGIGMGRPLGSEFSKTSEKHPKKGGKYHSVINGCVKRCVKKDRFYFSCSFILSLRYILEFQEDSNFLDFHY